MRRRSLNEEHDAADRVTNNQAGDMTGFTPPTGTAYSYGFDGDGVRQWRKAGSAAATQFSWDPATSLLLSDGTSQFVYGPGGMPVEQVRGTTATYLQGDQLGSTVLISTQAGATADTYSYDAYGKVATHTGTTTSLLQFNGQYADVESGLLYLRARMYDPATGQFTSRDPLEAATRQAYGYGYQNPLSFTDPSGLGALDDLSNFVAGFGDAVTFGGTEQIRRLINYELNGSDDDLVNHCSGWYHAGQFSGQVALAVVVAGAAPEMIAEARAGSARPFAQFGAEDLRASAQVADRNGRTQIGRALQKHAGRGDSVFRGLSGTARADNEQGLRLLEEIINDSGRRGSRFLTV